jgi:DNA repair/transcription protein MET18/MMS19
MLCVPAAAKPLEELEPRAAYGHSILTTLYQTILAKVDEDHSDVAKYIESLVPRLFNLFISSTLSPDENMLIATDPRLITVAGQIIGSIVQNVALQ